MNTKKHKNTHNYKKNKHNCPINDTDDIISRQTVIITMLHTFKRLMGKLSSGIDEIKKIKLNFCR